MPRVHNLIGGRIEPEIRDRIGGLRFRATHWIDGIAVGDLIRWNPAGDVDSLATFQVLSSYVPRGLNSVYKVELGRVAADVHIAGKTYSQSAVGHLVLIEAPAALPFGALAPCDSGARAPTPDPACRGRRSVR